MAEALIFINAKRIAVIGENRYEWEIAYLSIVLLFLCELFSQLQHSVVNSENKRKR